MTWEGVPWMVDGGVHSAEVGRLLAYAATGGGEGVVATGDCKVVASNIPDGNVHIRSGGIVALNRYPGGGQQTYIIRNVGDEVKALDPQGSSGVRYDLVAMIVEDPQYPGQPVPASEEDGPYVRTAIYKNVGPNLKTLAEVDADQTGVVLARVKFDASDGTITNADITDLRRLAMPKSSRKAYPQVVPNNVNLTSAAFITWPNVVETVEIPAWAMQATVIIHLSSVVKFDPEVVGEFRVRLGATTGTVQGYDIDGNGGLSYGQRQSFSIMATFDVSTLKGTSQPISLEARRSALTGYLSTWTGASMIIDVSFEEVAV